DTSAPPPKQERFLQPGSGIVWTNVDTSAPPPKQERFLQPDSGIVWTNDNTNEQAPRMPMNEGPYCGGDPSTVVKEVGCSPKDAEPCAKEAENMKTRIARYQDLICDLMHKESQHATEAGWTPAILNILKKTAEELAKLSTKA
ncbi:hypothetical protein KCU65_g4647, partial [Aureobasidium melanogenum]